MADADGTRVARLVADADVLAADLLVGGQAREAVDHARRHSWVELLASDPLLDDAEAVVADLASERLAADWRERLERECRLVEHPDGDHPALAAAYRGDAAHLLTFDDNLTGVHTNLSIQPHLSLSVRSPASFARLFDPERVYGSLYDDPYPGPDRDPRG
jgi:predicted nucleic acid-binding protein